MVYMNGNPNLRFYLFKKINNKNSSNYLHEMLTFFEFLQLAESSLLSRRLPSSIDPRGRVARRRASDAAVLRSAGFRSPKRGELSQDHKHSSSEHHETEVRKFPSSAHYTLSNIKQKRKASGKGVVSNRERKIEARRLGKQFGRSGRQSSSPVLDVLISATGSQQKGSKENQVSRGRSFHRELKSVPDSVSKIIGTDEQPKSSSERRKPRGFVTAQPAATMKGEDPKKGAELRAKIYSKHLGAKTHPQTGRIVRRIP